MALEIRSIPILTGRVAEDFVREADEMAEHGHPMTFSKDYVEAAEAMMERSRKFMRENEGKIIKFK